MTIDIYDSGDSCASCIPITPKFFTFYTDPIFKFLRASPKLLCPLPVTSPPKGTPVSFCFRALVMLNFSQRIQRGSTGRRKIQKMGYVCYNVTHLIFWRRGKDLNLRYVAVHTISSRAPSAARTPLRVKGVPSKCRTRKQGTFLTQALFHAVFPKRNGVRNAEFFRRRSASSSFGSSKHNVVESAEFFCLARREPFLREGWPLLACPPVKRASNDAKRKNSALSPFSCGSRSFRAYCRTCKDSRRKGACCF